jgi:hypothetical protein
MLIEEIGTLDAVLEAHSAELGDDLAAYRNHAYRVANLCVALNGGGTEHLQKIAVAAAFHDLGIWSEETFDYLGPSVALARAHVDRSGKGEWSDEIAAMIQEHHKLSRYRDRPLWLVEQFRRADWVDVSRGVLRFGLPRKLLREIFAAWPDAGFHARLAQLSFKRLCTHPWSPLPMLRL